ncbi:MAG: hypothetical protein LBK06_08915 [Planctomycetaceae bacterium]|nr:hypothetical protein [Planctomycetaceae bacterium]
MGQFAWIVKTSNVYAGVVLKFTKLNMEAQHRGAFTRGRSLTPIPTTV